MSDRLLEETTALLPMQNGGKAVVLCESILKLQDTKTDRLSREDERRKMAEWLYKRVGGTIPSIIRDCVNIREGHAPWA